MKGDEERCIEAGCAAYLSKPVDFDEMLNLIVELTSAQTETFVDLTDTTAAIASPTTPAVFPRSDSLRHGPNPDLGRQ